MKRLSFSKGLILNRAYSNDYNTISVFLECTNTIYEEKSKENKNIIQYLSKSEDASIAPILHSFYYTPGHSTVSSLEPGYLSDRYEDYSISEKLQYD